MPAHKNVHQKADEATAFAHMKALAQSSPTANDEAAADLWFDAEAVVDAYIDAAQARSASLPSRQALGESCYWLLFQSGTLRDDANCRLVVELLSPQLGLAMFDLLPRVQALRESVYKATASVQSTDDSASQQASEEDLF